MKAALEALPNIGTVAVSRTGPDGQLGYSWFITFVDNPGSFPAGSGDVTLLSTDSSSLGGAGADCKATDVSHGTAELSGGFFLDFETSADSGSTGDSDTAGGNTLTTTVELAYNALAEEVRKRKGWTRGWL